MATGSFFAQKTATILSGATDSDAIWCGNKVPVALQMPASFTGTAVSFKGSYDGSTYQSVYAGGSDYSVAVAASKNVALDGSKFAGFLWVKLVSNAAEGADRSVVVLKRRGE